MNNTFDDDKFSMTNVSLISENEPSSRNLTHSPTALNTIGQSSNRRLSTMKADELAVAGTSLKSQESTIDHLKKENFNLKLHQYFLMERLNQMSPETCEKLNEENIKLKVGVQSLTAELKKYKDIILELNKGIDYLQSKQCPIPHGMTTEEKAEMDKLQKEAITSQEEHDKISLMMADLTAENVRLRTSIRVAKTTPPPTPATSPESEEMIELKRNFRQAKIKVEEQQRAIQILQQNQHKRPSYSNQSDLKSADRELKQLEGELRLERLQSDRAFGELQDKKIELQNTRSDLDRLKTQLHHRNADYDDLRNEYELLKKKASSNPSSDDQTNDLIKAVQELEEDNEELVAAIQSRDQDVAALEAEVEKLLSHLDEKGMDEPVKEKVFMLQEALQEREEVIQEREDEIDILKKELKTVTESHDEDIEAFEEHMAKAQAEFNEQRQLNQELVEELENTKKYCQDDLTKQYNDMIVSIRERDVRLASLQGNFEQQTDTMEREKDLLLEEIGELKDKLHEVFDALNRQEETVIELRKKVRSREESSFTSHSSEEYASTMQRHVEELGEVQREMNEIRQENKSLQAGYLDMKKKYLSLRKRNNTLTRLLDEYKKSAEIIVLLTTQTSCRN
ncbi:microtubule associated-domain-containing protein [Mucor mucedo]|uniref:microtubule associated-domain-containing protein n=1 Tax=Mucor mucedo TaxID=29922 RepID=UPI00221EFC72|nr:microtubule associated-domain-containing protein [Mucor mucedo]KAI7894323.1 microtubule associated-domain-containing protein [Mucor mucedo]